MHEHDLGMNFVYIFVICACMSALHNDRFLCVCSNSECCCRRRKYFCGGTIEECREKKELGLATVQSTIVIEHSKQIKRFAIWLHFPSFHLVFHDKWLKWFDGPLHCSQIILKMVLCSIPTLPTVQCIHGIDLCSYTHRYWIFFVYSNKFYSYKFHIYVLFSVHLFCCCWFYFYFGLLAIAAYCCRPFCSCLRPSSHHYIVSHLLSLSKSLGVFRFTMESGVLMARARVRESEQKINERQSFFDHGFVFHLKLTLPSWLLVYLSLVRLHNIYIYIKHKSLLGCSCHFHLHFHGSLSLACSAICTSFVCRCRRFRIPSYHNFQLTFCRKLNHIFNLLASIRSE